MKIQDFISQQDYKLIQFSFSLIRDVEQKIHKKHLIYENQVKSYVSNKVEEFIIQLDVKRSLQSIYKAELVLLMKQHLNGMLKRNCLLKCV